MDSDINNYVVTPALIVEKKMFRCEKCKGEISSTAKIHKPTKKIYCGDCVRQYTEKNNETH